MLHVGIRELRTRLSHYLKRVKAGHTIQVTDRGEVIALVTGHHPQVHPLQRFIDQGLVRWKGGKPRGLSPRARVKGKKAVTDLLLEDRR